MPDVLTILDPKTVISVLRRFVKEVSDKDNYTIQSGLPAGSQILDADLGLKFFALEFKDGATGRRHELKARFTPSHLDHLEIRLDRDLDQQRGDWVMLPAARLHTGTSGTIGVDFHLNLKFTGIPLADNGELCEIVFDFTPA